MVADAQANVQVRAVLDVPVVGLALMLSPAASISREVGAIIADLRGEGLLQTDDGVFHYSKLTQAQITCHLRGRTFEARTSEIIVYGLNNALRNGEPLWTRERVLGLGKQTLDALAQAILRASRLERF